MQQWTNKSVLGLAGGQDPLLVARRLAAELADEAQSLGIAGPPVDVFALATSRGISLRPSHDLADARIAPAGDGLSITYNPNRPRGRLRFSVAHEIAHALFPDVVEQPRHRTSSGSVQGLIDSDDWELELICDVIAAELLLPEQAVNGILNVDPDIDFLMEIRRRWDVSTEALLRRVTSASPRPLILVAASRPQDGSGTTLRVDYAVRSVAASNTLPKLSHGSILKGIKPMLDCAAIGQTNRGTATVDGHELFVQAVGAPSYPGRSWPRVLALIEPSDGRQSEPNLIFVSADLLTEVGDGPVVFAHVVSDSVRGWSRFGVAGALSKAFPDFAGAYRAWTLSDSAHLTLGSVHLVDRLIDGRSVTVASIVAQAGFGRASHDRLQYDALDTALQKVREEAAKRRATVHVPRLGAGQAGGRWDRVEDLLVTDLARQEVQVVVHTPPAGAPGAEA